MTNTTQQTTRDIIQLEARRCFNAAARAGYGGTFEDYELTAEDCEGITDAVGRKPTRGEWSDAGWPVVGGAHVGEEVANRE